MSQSRRGTAQEEAEDSEKDQKAQRVQKDSCTARRKLDAGFLLENLRLPPRLRGSASGFGSCEGLSAADANLKSGYERQMGLVVPAGSGPRRGRGCAVAAAPPSPGSASAEHRGGRYRYLRSDPQRSDSTTTRHIGHVQCGR